MYKATTTTTRKSKVSIRVTRLVSSPILFRFAVHDVTWRSLEAVEFATLEWVDRFNNRRLLEPIGNIPQAEAKGRYYAMLEQPASGGRPHKNYDNHKSSPLQGAVWQ